MHIKSLTIHGFKSYRDQTVVDPFSAGVNVVVGRNGAGKSNFFAAIRFVLADDYTALSRQDRQSLLHEGTSTVSTFSAFVELVFDNSDHRFPTGKNEVVLRRTIGAKKDEYSLDRKSTPKGEILSLLESAGFSRSNPYYIVPQGRITRLTNQKDPERLDLLKEVAGTRVYEDRRAESMKIINETEGKREKINELLEFIDERLSELEEEKGELKEFQTLDRQRRVLEYQIHHRELEEVTEALNQLDADRQDDAAAEDERRQQYTDRERQLAQLERRIEAARHALQALEQAQAEARADRRDQVKARTQVQLLIGDLEEAGTTSEQSRMALQGELHRLDQSIAGKEARLTELAASLETAQRLEHAARVVVAEKSACCEALYAKQGRNRQFLTQAQRDTYLDSELSRLQSTIAVRAQREAELGRELEAAQTASIEIGERMQEARAKLDGRVGAMDTMKHELDELKGRQAELIEKRKALWKEDAKLEQAVAHELNGLRDAERQLLTMIDKATATGLKAVKRIASELNLQGCYGPVYELFTVSEAYRTAVEVTAGTTLFNVVCDTDATASKILEALTHQHAGRVTFMPLNRLRTAPIAYPPRTDDVFPILDKLQLKDRERDIKAFEQIFGLNLICRDLSMGPAYVRSHQLSVITPDGDRIDRKGAWTGGYHDIRRSRLDAIERTKTCSDRYDGHARRHAEVKQGIAVLDQQITALVGQVQVLEGKLRKARDERGPDVQAVYEAQKDEEQLRGRIESLGASRAATATEIATMRTQARAIQAERATPMTTALTADEVITLQTTSAELEADKRTLVDATNSRADLARERDQLEVELNESLRRRRDQLRVQLDVIGDAGDQSTTAAEGIQARRAELVALETAIDTLGNRLSTLETEVERQTNDLHELEREMDKTQAAQVDDAKSLARQQKSVERYRAKRQLLLGRKDDCNASIRELGVLPEEAFAKNDSRSEQLVKQLHKVNESLKKYAHVNKKAIEQYNNFIKQREELVARQDELDHSHTAIEELIESLDQRKDEAIERTFKQVSTYFSQVFEKLVPTGRGRLIMQKRLDEDTPESSAKKRSIDRYSGVAIKVSFNSKTDEGLRIQQLSGGQKSLVALAMVFAIQKCDPAPFYLFDEIDANLDADRRAAVASMIGELSGDAQFVITTFRPELLAHADKHFGVIFDARKVSTIRAITADQARTFIEATANAPSEEIRRPTRSVSRTPASEPIAV